MIVIHAFVRDLLTPLLLGVLAASVICGSFGAFIALCATLIDGQWRPLFKRK